MAGALTSGFIAVNRHGAAPVKFTAQRVSAPAAASADSHSFDVPA
jgi:hypothetical protein